MPGYGGRYLQLYFCFELLCYHKSRLCVRVYDVAQLPNNLDMFANRPGQLLLVQQKIEFLVVERKAAQFRACA